MFTSSFALESSFIFLAIYFIAIPCYLITVDYQRGMWRIGTYIAVFLEGKETEIYWERRLELFQERYGNQFVSSYNAPYILTSVGANFLFAIQYRELAKPVCGISYTGWIVISIVILLCFLLYIISQENAAEIKRTYIKQWIEIKESTDIGDLEGWRMALRARLGKKETKL